MPTWITPVTDRSQADVLESKENQASTVLQKGSLNYTDLNRIESNFQYIEELIQSNGYYIPHQYRNFTEVTNYEGVESYLQSNGSQYIDTGYKPNSNTRVIMDCELEAVPSSQVFFFGSRNAATGLGRYGVTVTYPNPHLRFVYGSNTFDNFTGLEVVGRHKIDANKNDCTIDGVTGTISGNLGNCNYNMLLFACDTGGTVGLWSSIKLFACQIYDNDALIRDFIPSTDADNVACLYDNVSKEYYYNQGEGAFIYGEETKTITQEVTYTDWQEVNLPYKEEIDRIRKNHNNLLQQFLNYGFHSAIPYSNYMNYEEVNTLEDIVLRSKEIYEKMNQQKVYCGTIVSGGDLL